MCGIEKWHLLPSHCRYFNKTFIEMIFLISLLLAVCVLVHYSYLLVAMETKMQKNKTIIIINMSSDITCSLIVSYYRNIHHIKPLQIFFFKMKISSLLWLLWQLGVSMDLYLIELKKKHILTGHCRYSN